MWMDFRKLTESPYLESVDWKKWYVFWADERVVPKDHVDSNYKLAYDGLLSKVIEILITKDLIASLYYVLLLGLGFWFQS